MNAWNCHAMSTERYFCPNAIQLMDRNSCYDVNRMVDENDVNDIIASLEEEYEGKKVAENRSPFVTLDELAQFERTVPKLELADDNSEIHYKLVHAFNVVREIIAARHK